MRWKDRGPVLLHLPGGCLTRVAVVCEFLRQGSGMDSLTPAARQAGLVRVFQELMGITKEREPAPLDCVLGQAIFWKQHRAFQFRGLCSLCCRYHIPKELSPNS